MSESQIAPARTDWKLRVVGPSRIPKTRIAAPVHQSSAHTPLELFILVRGSRQAECEQKYLPVMILISTAKRFQRLRKIIIADYQGTFVQG